MLSNRCSHVFLIFFLMSLQVRSVIVLRDVKQCDAGRNQRIVQAYRHMMYRFFLETQIEMVFDNVMVMLPPPSRLGVGANEPPRLEGAGNKTISRAPINDMRNACSGVLSLLRKCPGYKTFVLFSFPRSWRV
jgi:hypothetical protein